MRKYPFLRRGERCLERRLRHGLVLSVALVAGAIPLACASGSTDEGGSETGGSGGPPGSGGGLSATGGMTEAGGSQGAGNSTGSGGSTGTGAFTGTGGSTEIGGPGGTGAAETGGVTGTGGSTGIGGSMATAGTTGSGAGGTGATGHGGTSGGQAGTTGASCSVSPVDPAATPQAKNLLCYLYSIYGNHVLSGQQETSWSNPAGDISYYVTNVGKYPAILGGDYLYPSGTTSRAQAYWEAGGLTMMRYHMGAPPLADSYQNSEMSTNYANVLTSGTAENKSLLSKLDYLAGELLTLQKANVAVIMALFHEVQPNGWFWWAKGTGAQFNQLWQLSFNYLTQTKGVHNVVWLVPFSGSPSSSDFPGKMWTDLAGPDEYAPAGSQPFTSTYTSARGVIGTTIPIPLHETGAVPQPASMFPTTAPWLLWNIWAGYEMSSNTVASLKSAYSSSYTITRDLLPKH
jgi:glycosyl hydrolase family 26